MWELIIFVAISLISFLVNRAEAAKKKKKEQEIEDGISIKSSMKKFKRKSNFGLPFEPEVFGDIIKQTKVAPPKRERGIVKNNKTQTTKPAAQKQKTEPQIEDKEKDIPESVESQPTKDFASNGLTDMIVNDRMSAFVAYEVFGPPKSLRKD